MLLLEDEKSPKYQKYCLLRFIQEDSGAQPRRGWTTLATVLSAASNPPPPALLELFSLDCLNPSV